MCKEYPVIIAITGASGSIYGLRLAGFLLSHNYRVILVISENSKQVIKAETGLNLPKNLAETRDNLYKYFKIVENKEKLTLLDNQDLAACISSGSYLSRGMIIAPCSMNTLGAIHSGIANTLITRAADVCIKQNRPLILSPREMPFSTIHLRNMHELSAMGVKIVVAAPSFYHNPHTIDDMINSVVSKILDVFEVPNELCRRWE
jgi:4-hydroxy-3-polyprenylbenzoate decarboxylase